MRSCRSLALAASLALVSLPAAAGVTTGDGSDSGTALGLRAEVTLAPEVLGDPDASGEVDLTLDARRGVVCFDIDLDDDDLLDPIVAAHIHAGAAGDAYEDLIVADLDYAEQGERGCVRVGRHVVASIIDNADSKDPSQFYLHLHTSGFPRGAVRGQIVKH